MSSLPPQAPHPFQRPEAVHHCAERARHQGLSPRTEDGAPEHLYGAAFTALALLGGRWWAHNEEYSTEVSFCPWCGTRLEVRT